MNSRMVVVSPQPVFSPWATPLSVLHEIRAFLRLGSTGQSSTCPVGSLSLRASLSTLCYGVAPSTSHVKHHAGRK